MVDIVKAKLVQLVNAETCVSIMQRSPQAWKVCALLIYRERERERERERDFNFATKSVDVEGI
jgi:hypothetical protein